MADIPPIPKNDESGDFDLLDVCAQNDALIRFYFKENPDRLDDYEYARRIKELKFLADEGMLKAL